MQWIPITNKRWTLGEFKSYMATVKVNGGTFSPRAITMHHTYIPGLSSWKKNDWRASIANLVHYYRDNKEWHAGPHLFIDDEFVYGFTPLEYSGIHAESFNWDSWGVEVIGDFGGLVDANGNPTSGAPMGDKQKTLVCKVFAEMFHKMDIDPTATSLRFHRDDPKTKKNCPGAYVSKGDILKEVLRYYGIRKTVTSCSVSIPSLLVDGSVYISSRPFMKSCGGSVLLNGGAITVARSGIKILVEKNSYITVDGTSYIPLRSTAEKLGLTVLQFGNTVVVNPKGT